MAAWDKRFVRTYKQSGWSVTFQVWVDRETGVNYIYSSSGYSGGLTPLLDREGKPVVTPVSGSDWPNDRYR